MSLRDQMDKLSPREQRLLGVLGILAALLLLVGLPAWTYTRVTAERGRNEEIREVLGRMDSAGELLALRRAEREAVALRYAKGKVVLGDFISGAARDNGLEVPESKPQPDIKGKGFIERVHEVKLRKVGLQPLVKMLEKIERSGYPVAITELSIKTRGPDSYDVELSVSAFEKEGGAAPKPAASAPAKSKSAPVETAEPEDEP